MAIQTQTKPKKQLFKTPRKFTYFGVEEIDKSCYVVTHWLPGSTEIVPVDGFKCYSLKDAYEQLKRHIDMEYQKWWNRL